MAAHPENSFLVLFPVNRGESCHLLHGNAAFLKNSVHKMVDLLCRLSPLTADSDDILLRTQGKKTSLSIRCLGY